MQEIFELPIGEGLAIRLAEWLSCLRDAARLQPDPAVIDAPARDAAKKVSGSAGLIEYYKLLSYMRK
jgi:hypothetical protein